MARFDAERVLESGILGVEVLPFTLGFLAVDLERTELLAVRAGLDPGDKLERDKEEHVSLSLMTMRDMEEGQEVFGKWREEYKRRGNV